MLNSIPPFVIFYIGALFVAITQGWIRRFILLLTPVVTGLLLLNHEVGNNSTAIVQIQLFEYLLMPFRIDKLSMLFGYLFILTALIGNIFSVHVKDTGQLVAGLVYSGSALGAVFAGDLLTLFIFWEMLAISSVVLIWARRTEVAIASGFRYLIIQVLSGVLLLSGTLIICNQHETLVFDHIKLEGLGAWLIFIAFGIKCAFPLLHSWLTDAYPEATPTGSVFLSAFSTKVAVYALARAFAGTDILIEIGAVMTLFPVFYAIIENDLRRVLAYLMITQIGIMVIGIGIGTPLGINGAVAHMFIHVIYKSLLFMTMGVVLFSTGRSKISELGGLYKPLPQTAVLCIFGVLFLLFSGFISKALVMHAAIETNHTTVWLILLCSAAGVFFASLKIPFYAFFASDPGIKTKAPPANMLIAMYLSTGLCIVLAMFPHSLYRLLPYPLDYWPYDLTHILTHVELVCFATLAFVWLQLTGLYPTPQGSIYLDVDWFYRKPLKVLIGWLRLVGHRLYNRFLSYLKLISLAPNRWILSLLSINGPIERMPPSKITITTILGIFALTLLILMLP